MSKGFVVTPAADKLVASNAAEQAVFDSAKRQETKIPNIQVGYGQQLVKYMPAPKAEVAVAF
jgi:hypothetical protein